MRVRTLLVIFSVACASGGGAFAQASREAALTALRAAAGEGNVDAQLALGGLLDRDAKVRDDEAQAWYERAARGGSRLAQRRYIEMRARPDASPGMPRGAFVIRLPRTALGDDGPPPDIPPGYHCHPLGNQRMWCHGGTDGTP